MLRRFRLRVARWLLPRGWFAAQVGDHLYGPDQTFVAVKFHDRIEAGKLVAWAPDDEFGVVSMGDLGGDDA